MTRLGSTTTVRMEAEPSPAVEGTGPEMCCGELIFRVRTHRRRSATALAALFSLATGLAVWSRASTDVVVELAVLAALACVCIMWIRQTQLHVSADGLLATGDLGGYRSGSLRLPWERVRELHYGPGGGEEVGGLYALEGSWCSRCILPRVTESQAAEVVATIAQHFPAMLPLSTARSTHVAVNWPAANSHAGAVTGPAGAVDVR